MDRWACLFRAPHNGSRLLRLSPPKPAVACGGLSCSVPLEESTPTRLPRNIYFDAVYVSSAPTVVPCHPAVHLTADCCREQRIPLSAPTVGCWYVVLTSTPKPTRQECSSFSMYTTPRPQRNWVRPRTAVRFPLPRAQFFVEFCASLPGALSYQAFHVTLGRILSTDGLHGNV